MKSASPPLTLDDFMQRYSDEGPFEVIDGEIVPVTPQNTRSGIVAGELFLMLAPYVKTHALGQMFIEVPFAMQGVADWVTGSRVPDLMFITAARLAALAESDPEWDAKPLLLVPDLVVEIVSPADRVSVVEQKIARYLDDGVRVVWLVEPTGQTVTIYPPDSQHLTRLTRADTLDGGDLLPGFALPLSEIFPDTPDT